jgi:2-haloacid dehalogenase
MRHLLFLFDLDDTLLDFKASEQASFALAMGSLGLTALPEGMFEDYRAINQALWRAFERGEVDKEFLKTERFRQTFLRHGIGLDPQRAGMRYLESLPETVVLNEGARQVCETLAGIGEIGIITNGVQSIQARRVQRAGLSAHVSFVATSEACGHAKPDARFFDFTVGMARAFDKATTVIVGDRLDADILGGNRFGIESCWFNPSGASNDSVAVPTYEVARLDQVVPALHGASLR